MQASIEDRSVWHQKCELMEMGPLCFSMQADRVCKKSLQGYSGDCKRIRREARAQGVLEILAGFEAGLTASMVSSPPPSVIPDAKTIRRHQSKNGIIVSANGGRELPVEKGWRAAASSFTSTPRPGVSFASQYPFSVFSGCVITSHRHGTSVNISYWMRKLGVLKSKCRAAVFATGPSGL